jgi:hypothetical protein
MSKRPAQAQPDTDGLSADHPERIASGTDGAPQWCRVVQKSAPAYLQDAGPASRVYMRPALDCRHVLARIWMAADRHGSHRPGRDLNRNRRSGRAVCAQRSLHHRGWLGQLTQSVAPDTKSLMSTTAQNARAGRRSTKKMRDAPQRQRARSVPAIWKGRVSCYPANHGHRGRRLATAQPGVSKPGRSTAVSPDALRGRHLVLY